MNEEHVLVSQVYAAKEDMAAADRLISSYLPFIKSETAKYLKRPVIEENDDELSIAM
ncbi:MAG: RNA polymerase subunit sigma, partial [Lachnospiraceae bacterium]|nr:RNA polymerase subunit sigma [Lachnospiraceae bacterium]